MKQMLSHKSFRFGESVIREMSRLNRIHGGINLSQGFPDFGCPDFLKEAAIDAIREEYNQYAITWGAKSFRDALVTKYKNHNHMTVDAETDITVCCGATEAMISAFLAIINPGDEVIIFEPYYENYGPDAILTDATPRFVKLNPPDWTFDEKEVAAAFNDKTKAIIINTPNNPTGRVFTREELTFLGDLCQKWNVLAVTDEPYEYMVFDGRKHISVASLDGMAERTITISAFSKTYAVTGWRLGYAIAPPKITDAIRKMHDFLTVGAPHPLQEAVARVLPKSEEYLKKIPGEYQERRDVFMKGLAEAEMEPLNTPEGAYYVMVDIGKYGFDNDTEFARWMVQEIGVATVPGSSFYMNPEDGHHLVRFCFPKKLETLHEGVKRLKKLLEFVKK